MADDELRARVRRAIHTYSVMYGSAHPRDNNVPGIWHSVHKVTSGRPTEFLLITQDKDEANLLCNQLNADAAISACDPIDTATGRTWKERFLERGAWQPISEAKMDGTAYPVWVAPYRGLDGFLTVCGYHPDAGWCADELREVTHFIDCPLTPLDKRQAKERRVKPGTYWGRTRATDSITKRTGKDRRKGEDRRAPGSDAYYGAWPYRRRDGKDRRKAQPETSEVE